ncbi:hypothetical protein ESY86_20685 [Subsaximicrobium wynnwilliamsii]|uniref:Uncharacterized protein n=1 Tax=Subsaximicrobium wynnwilliamsii TaxID=291179 RepID=A0A5C6Z8W8_9FLAO|nr:hypothetical protein [Subsaximicrobium wynnwilliamsii]TXD80637.1 hypothetical protein ESY87_20480 [Subsaximicrobium wynnwilliamsii]TXD85980.1 hypothetical protein ESY86_20685 [Subsaximicrobium wynnwilliamsii]TXD99764.1 hypothetical protein ESY88_20420 [Subsaximicrobium wynnwilliamsii]
MIHNPRQREDVGGKHQHRQLDHEQNSTQVYGFKASRFENKQARFNRDTGSSEAIVGVFHQQSQPSETKDNLNRNHEFSEAIVGVFHQQSQPSKTKAHINYQMQI